MVLDGGLIFKQVVIASVTFWILTLMIMIRRGSSISNSDVLLVKWGYLPILSVTCIVWLAASAILYATG